MGPEVAFFIRGGGSGETGPGDPGCKPPTLLGAGCFACWFLILLFALKNLISEAADFGQMLLHSFALHLF